MTSWRSLLLATCLLASAGNAAADFMPPESYGEHRIDAAWDAGGRLQTLTDTSGTSIAAASFQHDAAGRLTKIERANGATSTYAYNEAGHVTQITHANGSKTLATFAYERDAKGRLTKATETLGSSTTTKIWEYDKDGKLTKESVSAQGLTNACSYTYDAVGNRTQKDCDGVKTTYSYNNLDQLTQESNNGRVTAYRYDGRGNLIEKKTAAATITYQWSSDNRLQSVSDGSTKVSYGYDALGRRISRTEESGANKTETQWILDTARSYSEIITERTRTNGGAWSVTSYTHTPDGVGLQVAETRNGNTRHIYADAQGSTRLVTDAAGNVIESLDFDAFGNETATNTKEARHRYTGESYDATTGLYHLRARDYDPQTGRFISMDEQPGSQRIPLSLNKYIYGGADPVNHIDPSGNFFGFVDISIGTSLSNIRSGLSAQGARTFLGKVIQSIVKSTYVGTPQRPGIFVKRIIDEIIDRLTGEIIGTIIDGFNANILRLNSGGSKQEFGRNVHAHLKVWCKNPENILRMNGFSLKCEPFAGEGGQVKGNPRGSVGVDVLVAIKNPMGGETPLFAIELKTGKGMNQTGKKGFDIRNERFFGKHKVAVIQIAIVPGSKRR